MADVKVWQIIREEAARAGLTPEQMLGQNRQHRFLKPRQYAMWRARKETDYSWWRIANIFGRDHTTVIHAYWSMETTPAPLRGKYPDPNKEPTKSPQAVKFLGKPCLHGHDGLRYMSNGGCVPCNIERKKHRYYAYKVAAE